LINPSPRNFGILDANARRVSIKSAMMNIPL
jgi:hypothetical protein